MSSDRTDKTRSALPGGIVLTGGIGSVWRAQPRPLSAVEGDVRRAILHAFAATGERPTCQDLDPVTAASGRTTADVLQALHDADAVRLDPDGQIVVAYPFSATPTNHRVRIGAGSAVVETWAMCAIDALGIAAMVGQAVRIESVDASTGQPVGVVVAESGSDVGSVWDPSTAVVFVGATDCSSALADCCCNYLNFFVDEASARQWWAEHPHIPGQILSQADAETLGVHLFGDLLEPYRREGF